MLNESGGIRDGISVELTQETRTTMWDREPALIIGAIESLLALALVFGVELTGEQVGGILAAVTAILAFVTRSQVTPAD